MVRARSRFHLSLFRQDDFGKMIGLKSKRWGKIEGEKRMLSADKLVFFETKWRANACQVTFIQTLKMRWKFSFTKKKEEKKRIFGCGHSMRLCWSIHTKSVSVENDTSNFFHNFQTNDIHHFRFSQFIFVILCFLILFARCFI